MRTNKWQTTTDSIGFDINGDLINGQHRLSAVVKVGKPFEFIVTTGLDPDAFNVIDTVKVRSAGDVLGVNDFNCPAMKAGIVRFLIAHKRGKATANALSKGSLKISNQDVLDFANDHRDKVNECGLIAQRTTVKFRGLETRYVGGLYYLFAEKDKDYAEAFFKYFEDGVGLTANDPILILRQKLIQNMGSSKKVATHEKIVWTILAWNYLRSGKKVKTIRWTDSEEIPKIL